MTAPTTGGGSYETWWPTVHREIEDLNPQSILPVKVDVCYFARRKLDEMGLGGRLLTWKDIPFPGNGWQRESHAIVDPLVQPLVDGA